eukprot:scaffold1097_cov202-Prasinococcus_capsulatus_cf.AAC.1
MGLLIEEKRTTWWDILHPEVEDVAKLGAAHQSVPRRLSGFARNKLKPFFLRVCAWLQRAQVAAQEHS